MRKIPLPEHRPPDYMTAGMNDDTPTRREDRDDRPTVRGLAAGQEVFGRYVLEAVAGRGGMGDVLCACFFVLIRKPNDCVRFRAKNSLDCSLSSATPPAFLPVIGAVDARHVPAMPPAARISDMHTCPTVTPGVPPIPHVGGPIAGLCVPTVLIGNMPAAVVGDRCVCVGPPDTIAKGSATVLIGGKSAARMGDTTAPGGVVVLGFPTVLIGG